MIAVLQDASTAALFCVCILCYYRRDWFARRLYWLRHKMIRWLDNVGRDALSVLLIAAAAFLMACQWWFERMIP
jgi:hypothetical protein